jgi:3-methylcrotonyl-CoA carboxylase alpha subunit
MLSSLLIANRGEIARRIIRTARRMGVRTIAVVTDADRTWPHWREADGAIAVESYLSIEQMVAAARQSGAEAVHPGYGFLSENAAFADACAEAGLIFVGPPASAIRAMGSKADAKALMRLAGVPVVPGYAGERQEADFLRQKAYEIGYPVLIKAVAGGGGRGMRRVDLAIDFEEGLASARREALASFGDDRMILERYVKGPRHIEVQVFADAHDNAVHLFERDCSLQRRHQKVMEEAPAPGLTSEMRQTLGAAAVKAARAVGYRGAGTVEFIAEGAGGNQIGAVFFIEMNTRLQVEHPVTEAITGLDLVEWQLRIAAGEPLPLGQDEIGLAGHAIEARIYAEDPSDGFRPSGGRIWAAAFPEGDGIRVDSGVEPGSVVSPFYDAMLAKLIVSGADRVEALQRLTDALRAVRIAGPKTNLAFLTAIAEHPEFAAGGITTDFADRELAQLAGAPLAPGMAAGAIEAWAAQAALHAAAAAPGPWARCDGFRLGGVSDTSRLAVDIDGRSLVAELAWFADGPRVASLSGEPAEAEPHADTEIVWAGAEACVLAGGRQLRIAFPDPLARRSEAAASGGEVRAPIHGRVVSVAVAPGDHVAAGDPLFTLEAMKMEHSVTAPIAGLVEAVCIEAGQQVEEGALAVAIAAAEADETDSLVE